MNSESAVSTPSPRPLQLSTPGDREIVIVRSFDAPRSLMWEAFTKAEHLRRWWGPRELETLIAELDFKVGGRWRFVHRRGGEEHGFHGEFKEITPQSRLVYTFEVDEAPGHVSTETVELSEKEGRTTLTQTARFDSKEARDAMLSSGMEKGAGESMDRLAELVTRDIPREAVLERLYDAPCELVYRAYTESEHVSRWWGPDGYTIRQKEMDVRPGGLWRFDMIGPDGKVWNNRVEYREVVKNEWLTFDHGSDEEPKMFFVTVRFTAMGNRTLVSQRMTFPTAEAREAVKKFGADELGMQTQRKLAEYLKTIA